MSALPIVDFLLLASPGCGDNYISVTIKGRGNFLGGLRLLFGGRYLGVGSFDGLRGVVTPV